MSYNPITENLSFNYQDAAILSDFTVSAWNKQLYDVIATDGNITITLPGNPIGNNIIEPGSIFFRRLDTVGANTVTVIAVINGTQKFINIPPGSEVVHWFVSVFDGSFGSTSFYFQLNAPFLLGGDVSSVRPVNGISQVTVNSVGGKTSSQVASSVTAVSNASSASAANTLVLRDATGNFSANIISATNLNATNIGATTATGVIDSTDFNIKVKNVTDTAATSKDAVNYGSLLSTIPTKSMTSVTGDVTGAGPGVTTTTVASVGGQTASAIVSGVIAANAATASSTVNTIMLRDSSGNTAVNQVTLGAAATLPNQAARLSQLPVLPSFDALNVYVAGSGSDTNVGSIVSPFATISKAETMATGSGNIWIQNGSYSDNITITKDNIGWTSTSNSNTYKCIITGTVSITGASTRRAFKGLQFSTGIGRCIEHTSSKGILNLENCAFSSSHPSPLAIGGSISSNTFNYINACDFTGMSGSIILANNNNNAVALNCVTGSNIVYISSGTLTVGTFITGDAVPGGTLVLAALGGNSYLISNNATLSGTLAFYNAVVWYITGCSGLKIDVGMGHLALGYNNVAPTVAGATKNYLETSRPLVTVVSNQAAMLAQTYATFGGLGCMTKVTSDSTAANNGLWQCVGYTISSLSSWLQIAGAGGGSTYTAGTGLTLTGSTFSITPQTASRTIVSDGSGNLTSSAVTSTTLGFLDATSSVQTQLNSKVNLTQNERTVKVVTTSTFTLSGSVSIDGVVANPGDEVLVAPSSSAVTNGIWTVQSGAWTRSAQMPTGSDPFKAKIFVSQGTQHAGSIWSCLNASGSVVGTTTLTISKFNPISLSGLNTFLTTSLASTDTTINVSSTSGFSTYGLIMIGSEVIYYNGKTPTTLTGCVRGSNGTTAVAANLNTYVHFLSEEIPYIKAGADFTVSTNPQRVYRSHMWMSGGATAVRTWYPYQIPWVYADITAAELACVYWIQQLTMFFKDMENDNQYDQLIGALPAFIVSRITGNYQVPNGSTDMDNNVGPGITTYASEWFELIVGRNQAGTELYTMSFTLALTSDAAFNATGLYPFRILWQTTRGAGMAGFSGQAVSAISGAQPRCTVYGSGGVTIPSGGFPLWAVPVTFETLF